MIRTEHSEAAFHVDLMYQGNEWFIINGLNDDKPVDMDGYVVLINESGARAAYFTPQSRWVFDKSLIEGYKKEARFYEHKIPLHNNLNLGTGFENE